MNDSDFQKLCESIKQAGEIKKGLRKPSRVVETNPNYWDCECESNYIHKKTETKHCVKCDAHEDEQPDSIQSEVSSLPKIDEN